MVKVVYHSGPNRASTVIDHAVFPASSFRVRPDTRSLGLNPNNEYNGIHLLGSITIVYSTFHSLMLLRRFSRSSRGCFASEARLSCSFPLKRSLTCRSFLLAQLERPATSFVYITIKSSSWQPALVNKFASTFAASPNFFLPSTSISPSRQEPKPQPLSLLGISRRLSQDKFF